jgi:hypothetical protein
MSHPPSPLGEFFWRQANTAGEEKKYGMNVSSLSGTIYHLEITGRVF